MVTKKSVQTGKDVAVQIKLADSVQHDAAFAVAGEVVNQFTGALKIFAGTGEVGNAINATAPGILMNPEMVLPEIKPLSPGERAATKLKLFYAILDPDFEHLLGDFQHRMVMSDLDQQVVMLNHFTSIDWDTLSRERNTEVGFIAKLQAAFYYNAQMSEVRKAELQQILVLTRVPQFVQLLTLASGYGKLMLAAYASFNKSKGYLDDNGKKNEEIVATLDSILQRFSNAEEKRLRAIAEVEENTKLLEDALELTKVLADLDDRSGDMLGRIEIDKKLVAAMAEHTEETVKSQLAQLDEMIKSMHLLASNQARKAEVTNAVLNLDLYIKCYVIFEMILTMLQVYLLAASSAVKTLLAKRIQVAGMEYGKKFYQSNVGPLENVIKGYVKNFSPPLLQDKGDEPVDASFDEAEFEKMLNAS